MQLFFTNDTDISALKNEGTPGISKEGTGWGREMVLNAKI